MSILGGQAVQADQILRGWRDSPEVGAWLVPVNPPPPRALRFAARIKYLRTIVTELTYLLFLKMAEETDTEGQLPEGYRWADLKKHPTPGRLAFYKKAR